MTAQNRNNIIILLLCIATIGLVRFLIPVPNVSPFAAIALFGGAFFSKKYMAFLVPLLALFISDLFIGFHTTMWATYGSFAIIAFMGTRLANKVKPMNVFLSALSGSVIFFVITNMGSWMALPMYTKNLAGLISAFEMGIPFYRNTLMGDLAFTFGLFGLYALIQPNLKLRLQKIRSDK